MSQLDALKAQKKTIEQQIRELENQSRIEGDIKIDVDRYPKHWPTRYYLAVCTKKNDGKKEWNKIYQSVERQETVDAAKRFAEALQTIYEKEMEAEQ